MHADLVGAPGVQGAHHQRGIRGGIIVQHFPVRDGGFAAAGVHHGHFQAVDGVAADVGEHGAFLLLRAALDHGQVDFAGVSLGKLGGEGEVGLVILCHHDAAAGVLVQAVHDAGALHTADAG